ncbi:MAG: hypothetical protein ACAH80_06835 [Alphaproteobacteria bacterium]
MNKFKFALLFAKDLPKMIAYKASGAEKKIRAIYDTHRAELRGYPDFVKDEKTGKTVLEVVFKEGTTPDLATLPSRIGIWKVTHDFRKPYLNSGELRALFDANAAAINAVQDKLASDMQGLGMNCDRKTSGPQLNFIFRENSKPDLTQLPATIGPFAVTHEFRGPAYLL